MQKLKRPLTLRGYLLAGEVWVPLLVGLFVATLVGALGLAHAQDQNKAYHDQVSILITLEHYSPAERMAYAEGLLRGDNMHYRENFDDRTRDLLRQVIDSGGEIPPNNRGLHSLFWNIGMYIAWALIYMAFTLGMLISMDARHDDHQTASILHMPWRRVWPIFYVLFMLANPLALIAFAGTWYELTHPKPATTNGEDG